MNKEIGQKRAKKIWISIHKGPTENWSSAFAFTWGYLHEYIEKVSAKDTKNLCKCLKKRYSK